MPVSERAVQMLVAGRLRDKAPAARFSASRARQPEPKQRWGPAGLAKDESTGQHILDSRREVSMGSPLQRLGRR
jgi:hypothetical protein